MGVDPCQNDTTGVKKGGFSAGVDQLTRLMKEKEKLQARLTAALNQRASNTPDPEKVDNAQEWPSASPVERIQSDLKFIEYEIKQIKQQQQQLQPQDTTHLDIDN